MRRITGSPDRFIGFTFNFFHESSGAELDVTLGRKQLEISDKMKKKPNTGLPKITTRWIWRPTTKFTSIDQAYLLNDTILFILLNHLGHRFGQQWTTLLDIASMLALFPGLTMCLGRRQNFVAGQGSLCFAVKYEWSKTFCACI